MVRLRRVVVRVCTCAFTILALFGCDKDSDDKTSKDGGRWTDSSNQRESSVANLVDMADLTHKQFSLRTDLSFAGASARRYKQFQGTGLETETVRHSYFFRNNHRVSLNEAVSAEDFCEVFVEASPSVSSADIAFAANQKLTLGTTLQSVVNGRSYFVLMLQASPFNHFMLRCQNVPNSTVLKQHVGDVFAIVPLNP